MGNEISADLHIQSLASVLRAEIARLDQGDHEMEVVCGDNLEWDIHQHINRCQKNPDHKDFIPVNKLTLDHIPSQWRDPGVLALIKNFLDVAVRLVVRYTSPDRPDSFGYGNLKGMRVSRFGTGWFDPPIPSGPSQPCPFDDCSFSKAPHEVSPFFYINTAAHVVFDNSEARKTVIEFFYDSEKDRSSILKAEGVKISFQNLDGDFSHITCVTHDPDWKQKLERLKQRQKLKGSLPSWRNVTNTPLAFIVSHPHGSSKQVTFGNVRHIEHLKYLSKQDVQRITKKETDSEPVNMCRFKYKVPTCPGSSGAPVFALHLDRGTFTTGVAPHSRHKTAEQVNESGIGTWVPSSF